MGWISKFNRSASRGGALNACKILFSKEKEYDTSITICMKVKYFRLRSYNFSISKFVGQKKINIGKLLFLVFNSKHAVCSS